MSDINTREQRTKGQGDGLVSRAVGFLAGRQRHIDDALATAEGRSAAPAPAPAPRLPANPRANKDNPAGIRFANDGPVRGPGTSDDIPDKVPEGTYIMPAESTQAIGEAKLGQMGGAPPQGFNPDAAKQVNVQLSNGEYKLPPEQVHAIGVQALDAMKGATHTRWLCRRPAGQRPAVPG